MFRYKYFLLAVIVFVLSLGLLHQPTAYATDAKETTDDRMATLEKELAEIRIELETLKKIIGSKSSPFSVDNEINEDSEEDSRAWLSPLMGWEADYTNDRLYALSSSGGVDDVNVGIGTNSPLTPFHLVGDFYNQGFAGTKSNYDPGATYSNVAEVTITTHGTGEDNSVVLLYAHVQDYSATAYVDIFIRVIRDGTTVVGVACAGRFVNILGPPHGYMGPTLISYDEPASGTHTYTLQMESVLAPALGYNFFAIELKR